MPEQLLLVTGKLAEPAVREVAETLDRDRFSPRIAVLPISVAALMHTKWIARRLEIAEQTDRVLLPGKCEAAENELSAHFGVRFEKGPADIFDLPRFLAGEKTPQPDLTAYDIEILAEINHAPRLDDRALLAEANRVRQSGADVIDLGCIPGEPWSQIGSTVARLRADGFRVSVDSFDRTEVEAAVANGAELVLSCNSSNIAWAKELNTELVVIPDDPAEPDSMNPVISQLEAAGRSFRIDPVLEPIGFGFGASLLRYFQARQQHAGREMLMGVGNLTELTEVDSAGINFLLAAICQELRIRSVLTTEVINWARSSVRELDIARRLVKHAIEKRVLPKHVVSDLVMLRDLQLRPLGEAAMERLAQSISDPNFRIFAERGELHLINRDGYWRADDAFALFDQIAAESPVDATHAFYLGYELAKAQTALTLGKHYRQDEALRWGMLTQEETSAIERRRGTSDE